MNQPVLFDRQYGLKRKFILWLLLVAMVPLLIVSVVSYGTAKKSLQDSAHKSLSTIAVDEAWLITNWFDYRMVDLKSQAVSQRTIVLLKELRKAFESGNEDIGEFVKTQRWARVVDEYADDFQAHLQLNGYSDILLLDNQGDIVFSVARGNDLGTNLFNGQFAGTKFSAASREAYESGEIVFSDLEYYDSETESLAGFLVSSVLDQSGNKVGLIAVRISPEQIGFSTRYQHDHDGAIQVYIVGADAQGDGASLRTPLPECAQCTPDEKAHALDTSSYLGMQIDTPQTRLWLEGRRSAGPASSRAKEQIVTYKNHNNEQVLGIHQGIEIGGVKWGIIAEIPERSAYASSSMLWQLMIWLVAITGAVVVVVAVAITRRIVRPIEELSHVARLVAQGDLSHTCLVSSNDEIGDLTKSFNLMVLNLRATINELENLRKALDEHAIVSTTDIGGRIIQVNDEFCKLSGYTREELLGEKHSILRSGEHTSQFYKQLWKTISSGDSWSGEIKNRSKDGTYYWVSATIVPFKDSHGKITKYVAIRTDITDLKEIEVHLEEGNISLSFALDAEQAIADQLEQSVMDFKKLASTDKLTGLPNRGVFIERLEEAMKESERNGGKYAVLFFDFDRFKVINDSLGHDVGDELLCDIARIFENELRQEDTAARFGGDEFVVLLTNLKEWADAELMAARLLRAFDQPHQLGGHLVVSTASIGLVTNRHAYKSSGDMIRDADAAMFQAKENGKAQVVLFDQAMHDKAMDRLVLEADIRMALAKEQFRLVYQPIVEFDTGRLKGFEALIRWDHPTRGIISPDIFIPIAEDTGLINPIGLWILRTAAAQIQAWNENRHSDQKLTMNVNVSKRQLLAPEFLDDVLGCKEEYHLKQGELQLEITESVIVDARSNVIPLLRTIREHGIPIVMDDFGTGVSSLSTLHSYPIDVLKIDQSFIRVLDGDRSLLAVVSSIAALADNLGIRTVAEGVETVDVVGSLQSIGCTWGQGYFFAKPLSQSDADAYIANDQSQTNAA